MLFQDGHDNLRRIVSTGRPNIVGKAAKRLADIGNPEIDVPLLKEALKSITTQYKDGEREMVQQAIHTLNDTPGSDDVEDPKTLN